MHSVNYRMDDSLEPTFNMRLIEAVKHSRCLYDSTDRLYRSSEHKNRVWNRLVQVLNFDGDSRTLYSRWKQLRDKYGKEKRKARYNNYVSSWQYYKHLLFLDDFMVDRSNMPVSPTPKEADEVQVMTADPGWGIALVQEVHLHPCLFDIRDAKYRHTDCRTAAWQEVMKNLNYPGDANSIYKQWKKLRDRYVREKRRLREQRDRGVIEDSAWDLYQHMEWMDPYLDDRAQTVKRKIDPDSMSEYDIDEMGRAESSMGFSMEKRQATSADVLLDGDSAFAASAVSDLRTLPDHVRDVAKQLIITLLETGRMPLLTQF